MPTGYFSSKNSASPTLVQEESGIHVGISPDLPAAARHASEILKDHYDYWLAKGLNPMH